MPPQNPPTNHDNHDYDTYDETRRESITAWWNTRSRAEKVIMSIVAVLAALTIGIFTVGALTGNDDSDPAPIEAVEPPVNPNPATEGNDTTTNRESRPAPRPREDTTEGNQVTEQAPPQDNSNDARAVRATYVLDSMVNDPEPSLDGFDKLTERLQADAALTPTQSIRDTYQMLDYTNDSSEFVSRASQPRVIDNGDGTYTVEYDVSGVLAPTKRGQSNPDLKQRVGQQMDEALLAGVSVPVEYTIDFNDGTVSIATPRWW